MLAEELAIDPLVARLLCQRGLSDPDAAARFLSPALEHLHDPLRLVDMPAAVPESLVTIAIGSVATILVLVRLISIPDSFFFAGRGIGIWISLACAVGIVLAGLLEASEEL